MVTRGKTGQGVALIAFSHEKVKKENLYSLVLELQSFTQKKNS